MSNAISSALLTGAAAASSPATAVQPVQPPVQRVSNNSGDTVTLTVAEQVYQLYNQGQQVSQIATSLRFAGDHSQ